MGITRQAFVISDLHLGGLYGAANDRGSRICSQVTTLTKFVEALATRPAAPRTELVVNGDFVDFLAEGDGSPPQWTPFVANGDDAASKLRAIIARDRLFFDALRRFLDGGHRLVLLPGNHDIELALPAVRTALNDALGVTGNHDFHFLYDGEAYVVGDAIIEHGDQYDPWNRVDHESLRKLRAQQSRRHAERDAHRFLPPPGSRLVSEVINPIKADYPFVDLLKPENEAVIPLLLALEPGSRRLLGRIASLCVRAAASAARSYSGDIAATGAVDPLRTVVENVMPGRSAEFLAALGEDQLGEFAGDISSTGDAIDRGRGLARLLTARTGEPLDTRLPALRLAMRALENHRTFDRHIEPLPRYLDAAAALSRNSFRFVVFGHTHLARDIIIDSHARYLNSGTWADVIEFPAHVLSDDQLEAFRRFVVAMGTRDLADWTKCIPTYVRLDLEDDRVAGAELVEYQGETNI